MQSTNEAVGDPRSNGASPNAAPTEVPGLNGGTSPELHDLLHAMQAMRVGDFSVRMSGSQVGLLGKIADTFNDIVAANDLPRIIRYT